MRARYLLLLGILAASRAYPSPTELHGTWMGAEEGFPIKHVVKDVYIEKRSPEGFSGALRYGLTGYKDERSLSVVTFEASIRGMVYQLHMPLSGGGEVRLDYDVARPDVMTGHVRHGRKGTRRALSFVRAGNADAATASFNRLAMKRSSAVALVYISTPDCTFCRTWERYSLPKYLETAAGREFRFLEVKGATLHSPVAPSDWPAAEQDLAKQVGPSRGVPRFVVVVDRRVILNQFGTGNWDHRVGPLLLQMAIWRSTSPE